MNKDSEEKERIKPKPKHSLLESYGIKVVPISVKSEDFRSAYEEAIAEMKKNWEL